MSGFSTVLSHSIVSDSLRPHGLVPHQASLSMGILQARILEWVAMLSSRGIFPTQVSRIAGRFFIATWEVQEYWSG